MQKNISNMKFDETETDKEQYSYYIYIKYPIDNGEVSKSIPAKIKIGLASNGKIVKLIIDKDSELDFSTFYSFKNVVLQNDKLEIPLNDNLSIDKVVPAPVNIDIDKSGRCLGIEIY